MKDEKDLSIFIILHQIVHMSKYQEIKKTEALGIKPGQAVILFMLGCKGGLSQKQLAQEIGITPPSMTVALRKMEESGFILREPDDEDQRVIRIRLSEKGRQYVDEIKSILEEMEELLYEGISPEERMLFRRLLIEMRDNLLNHKEFRGMDMHTIMKKTKPPIKHEF